MILPIVAYGDPVLKKRAIEITPEHPNLEQIYCQYVRVYVRRFWRWISCTTDWAFHSVVFG